MNVNQFTVSRLITEISSICDNNLTLTKAQFPEKASDFVGVVSEELSREFSPENKAKLVSTLKQWIDEVSANTTPQ